MDRGACRISRLKGIIQILGSKRQPGLGGRDAKLYHIAARYRCIDFIHLVCDQARVPMETGSWMLYFHVDPQRRPTHLRESAHRFRPAPVRRRSTGDDAVFHRRNGIPAEQEEKRKQE